MQQRSAETAVQRVALVASSGNLLADLAPPLVRRLLDLRHKPIALAADFPGSTSAFLSSLGCDVGTLPPAQSSLNPLADLLFRRRLSAVLSTHRPHAILAYDLPSAANVASVIRRISNARMAVALPSSGIELADDGLVLPPSIERQLRDIGSAGAFVLLPCESDVRNLDRSGLMADATISVAPQCGIDLAAHPFVPLPPLRDGFTFVTAAKALAAPDIAALIAAAKIVAQRSPAARFVIAGPVASERERARMIELVAQCPVVTWTDGETAFADALIKGHAVVHARSTGGLTGALLAALAAGRPIIATDLAGVRDAVDQIVNGILVPPSDGLALADAMLAILRRADALPAMAAASRLKAERRFDATAVNAALLGALRIPAVLGSAA